MWNAEVQLAFLVYRGKQGFCAPRALKNYLLELTKLGIIDAGLKKMIKQQGAKVLCARYGSALNLSYNPGCDDDGMPIEDVWKYADSELKRCIPYEFATYNFYHNSRDVLVQQMVQTLSKNQPCIVSSNGHAYVVKRIHNDTVHKIDTVSKTTTLSKLRREIETVCHFETP